MKKIYLIALMVFSGFCHAETYTFVSIKNLIEQDVGRIVLPKIYEKLGINMLVDPVPGKRAQEEATSGRKAGEIMRIWTYGEENPSVKRVETPYYYLETMAFIKKGSGISIKEKDDLNKYRLLKVRGVKHTNNITKGIDDVKDATSTEQMMNLLLTDRFDVALTNTVDGNLIIKKLGLESKITQVDNPLAVLDLYNYIHEDNSHLVEKVNEMIKTLKASGELDEIIKSAEKEVIDNYL